MTSLIFEIEGTFVSRKVPVAPVSAISGEIRALVLSKSAVLGLIKLFNLSFTVYLDDRSHFLEVAPVVESLSMPPNLFRYVAIGAWTSTGYSYLVLV